MDIKKEIEQSEFLAQAVLNAAPGSQEFLRSVQAECEWIRTMNEVSKTENELRMRQNEADDKLVSKRDDDAFREKQLALEEANRRRQFNEKLGVDVTGLVLTAAGTLMMILVTGAGIKLEAKDTPLFGFGKKVFEWSYRSLTKN